MSDAALSQVLDETVEAGEAGLRLDVFAAGRLEDVSRSFVQSAIRDGHATINRHRVRRPSQTLHEGDRVRIDLPPAPTTELAPEAIPLDVLYEDAEILVVNKPAGLVVHPAPGHPSGTLVNAVLHHCPDFRRPVGTNEEAVHLRPGIVHRLDRDTSGAMVVAKTQRAFDHLARQAREHRFQRRYLALVKGAFDENAGVIRVPIGRSTADRKRMAAQTPQAREAVTRYEVLEQFGVASYIAVQLETGRTHQIRVHMRFIGRPVLGDPIYGVTNYTSWDLPRNVREALEALHGQALHAELLGLMHPVTQEQLIFTAPLPADFDAALEALRRLASTPSA